MNVLGVQHAKTKKHGKRCEKGVKVVYISSPVKVKTCASKFRALVQELTGKDSDADAAALLLSNVSNCAEISPNVVVDHRDVHCGVIVSAEGNLMNPPAISDAAMESSSDDLFMPRTQREGSFLGTFTSNLFHPNFNFKLDRALESFDSV